MSNFVKEAIAALPRVTVMGREELLIENSRGICEFGENSITVRTTLGGVTITGEGLTIARAEADSVALFGKITSVFYI